MDGLDSCAGFAVSNGATPFKRAISSSTAFASSFGRRRMSTMSVGLNAQMNAWIHGTIGRNPAQPMMFTASASGCLRAIAIRPGSPAMSTRAVINPAPRIIREAKVT
jgi:hypothetical protein